MIKQTAMWVTGLMMLALATVTHAESPLTDQRVENLIGAMDKLQPMMQQVGQRLSSLPEDERPPKLDPRAAEFDPETMSSGMADALKKVDAYSDVQRIASENGFESADELLEVQARVMMGFMAMTQQAMMNNPNVPEKARKRMQDKFGNIGEKVSQNDQDVLQRNQQKLMQMMRKRQQQGQAPAGSSSQ